MHKILLIKATDLLKRKNQYIMMSSGLIHDKMGFKRKAGACETTPKP